MRDQIDIRRCVTVLLHHGWWIAALGAIAAGVTYLVGLMTPVTYTASALVGIIDRSNVVAFDPRFLPIERDLPSFEPYPALASSDAVLSDLLRRLGDRAPGDGSMDALRGRLIAALAADKVLLRLAASAATPDEAAALANAWAEVVVEHASALYEATDVALLARYEEHLAAARDDLARARDALVDYDVSARVQGLQDELADAEAESKQLQDELQALRAIERDAHAARAAVESCAGESSALGQSLDALLAEALRPMGENVSSPDSVTDDAAESVLDLIEQVLAVRMAATREALNVAQANVAELRGDLAEQVAERDALALAVREAEDRVLLVSTAAERVRLAADGSRIKVQLTSYAGVPTRPSSGGPNALAIALGGLAGLLFGIVLALFLAGQRRIPGGSASAEA